METPIYKSVSGLTAQEICSALDILLKEGYHLKEIVKEKMGEDVYHSPQGEYIREWTYYYTVLTVKA